MKMGFSRQIFRKKTQISNLTKICPVGAELFHADGRTDLTKLIVAFRNFAKAPQKVNITALMNVNRNEIILTSCVQSLTGSNRAAVRSCDLIGS
jgi:hypothetical protein